jgi:hypothetical protein
MDASPRLLLVAALCCVAGCRCNRDDSPTPTAQPATAQPSGRRVIDLPAGDPVSAEKLSKLLPREVGGYRAPEPSQHRTEKLSTGGRRPVAHRDYQRGEDELQVELTDTHHAPAVRAIMTLRRAGRSGSGEEVRPGEVRGFPALMRYHGPSRTAIVSVLVADRFLLNVKLLDVPDVQPALDVAGSIDLAAIARLAPPSGSATEMPAAEGEATGEPEVSAGQATDEGVPTRDGPAPGEASDAKPDGKSPPATP